MIDQDLFAVCNFEVAPITDDIVSLSWDASALTDENCGMYRMVMKTVYADYLSELDTDRRDIMYKYVKSFPEDPIVGTGMYQVFQSDLETIQADILSSMNIFICSEASLAPQVAKLYNGTSMTVPITDFTVLGTQRYKNEGIMARNSTHAYHTKVDIQNSLYALVTFDVSDLTKLKIRFGQIRIRLINMYAAYIEAKEILFDPEDSGHDYYVLIEDLAQYIHAVNRIIQEEITFEYK